MAKYELNEHHNIQEGKGDSQEINAVDKAKMYINPKKVWSKSVAYP